MKKKVLLRLMCLAVLLSCATVTAHADCAPKPSTVVYVNQTGAEQCVITLLAQEKEGAGPYCAVEPGEENPETEEIRYEAWEAFAAYEDPDGFYFWGETFTPMVNWGYYPPEVFKVALYFPEYDSLIVSQEIYERYAFQSKFSLWLTDVDCTHSGVVSMRLEKNIDWMEIIGGFLLRVVVTLAVELLVAVLWGYRSKRQMKVLLSVNLVTQVVLNALLSLWYIFDGPFDAMLRLLTGEIVVLAIESVFYVRRLPEGEHRLTASKGWALCYTIAANVLSCVIGWWILE